MRVLLFALATAAAAAKCNPELYEAAHAASITPAAAAGDAAAAPLTLLPQEGDESPAGLDGGPFGFWFQPSTTGSTKWTISINGGGWCYDEVDCYCRSKTQLGTYTALAKTATCSCMNPAEDGTLETDCNCLHLPYLDGASFSGYRAKPWPVPENAAMGVPANATVTFRGIKNLDGAVDFALAHGMDKATELVVTGGSAGGLSTFLHTDRIARRAEAGAPALAKVRGAPVVGYFLDHDNYAHTDGYSPDGSSGGPNTAQWSTPGTGANYTMWMKYVYAMQNMSFGGDGGLTAACQAKHAGAPHLCFMSPHMQDVIETPFFMFNSKYDAWQLGNEFQSAWATKDEQDGVLRYGQDFMEQLAPIYATGAETKHGGMITSCICHGCPWPTLELDGKSSYQHYADWFYGKTSGAASMHIDSRLPNGNGTIADPHCAKFP